MNKVGIKKMLSLAVITFVAATSVLFNPVARADSDNDNRVSFSSNKPKLYSVTDVTSNSAVLSFKDKKFRNESVNVIVSVKTSGMLVERQLKARLDDEGRGNVTVKNLEPGTHYKFKVRIMREGENRSTQNSSTKSASTR